ncbi:MAG: SH3 domain-containing protein [Anaerolineae bacterium]|nr:SH3 domain-containing protein [Anaerolineae bacterium]
MRRWHERQRDWSARLVANHSEKRLLRALTGAAGRPSSIDLMQQLIAYTSDNQLITLARDVLSALDEMRLYAQAAPRVQGRISFYSIYFPSKSKDFIRDYALLTPLNAWGAMLREYYNVSTPRLWQADDSLLAYHPAIAPKVRVTRVYPSVSSIVFPPTISVEIVGRRIASGAFTIDRLSEDGTAYRLAENRILTEVVTDTSVSFVNSWKSGVDQSYFNWLPMTLPVVTDGTVSEFEYLTRTGDNASLNGRYREVGSERWNDVVVIFNLDGTVRDVITQTASGALAAVKIPVGAEFQSYRYVVKSGGELSPEPNTAYTWGETGISWTPQAAPSGQYNLGFLVTAFGGASGFDAVQVTVDNATFPPDLAGYADINLGINFQRPAGWGAIADLGGWLTANSPRGDAVLNVYYFRATDDIFGVLETAQRRFDLELTTPATTYSWQDEIGLRFSHTYQTADGVVWNGDGLVFHRQTAQGERGMVFTLDTRADARVNRNALFNNFANSIQFFDAESLKLEDVSDWRYDFINRLIPYPVIKTWQNTTRLADGIWTVYRPVSDASRLTLAAIAQLEEKDRQVAMDAILAEFAAGGTVTQRIYDGEHHEWLTASFEVIRGGQPMVGRIYITDLNNRLYAFRFETPRGVQSVGIFREFFEPMIDGFAPPSDITFSSGTRTAFVKSAVITANDSCGDVVWNTICYGGGQPLQLLTVDELGEITLETADQTRPIDDILAFRVGVLEDGTVDPFSVALVNVQANIPNTNTTENIKLIVFGGATVVNKAILAPDTVNRLLMFNPLDIRVNIRSMPSTNISYVSGTLISTQEVVAVARTEDNAWVRVQLPDNPYQTGWVSAELLRVVDETQTIESLKIGNPNLPDYSAMQSIEILFDDQLDQTVSLNGVLIQTTSSQKAVYLEINGALFEIAGGSMFFWRGDVAGLENVSASEQVDAFGDVTSRRRPSSWTSEVLSGSVRIQIANADVQATITSVAGTQVAFDESASNVALSAADRSGGSLNSALSTSLGVVQLGGNLTAEEIRQLQQVQGDVNALDLNTAQDLPFFFGGRGEVFYFNQASFSDTNVLDYLFSQSPTEP